MTRFALLLAVAGSVAGPRLAAAEPATHAPAPTATPRPGIWISTEEVRTLPTTGPAWTHLKAQADKPAGKPKVSDQNQMNNVDVLAKALVFARTGEEKYRTEVRENCLAAIGTEKGGRTLALGRELAAYVIAADLVKLEAAEDAKFRAWLKECLSETLSGKTLRSTHEDRPNNWGTHAGGSRAAVAVYLGDKNEIARTAQVFKGWLGDRAAYADFKYGDLSWQSDPAHPRGVNPKGSTKEGKSVDGVMPDDMRRGGKFQFPPGKTNYTWGALEGAMLQAEILSRQGYDAWGWEDQALRRSVQYLADLEKSYPKSGWWADGDDVWMVWVVNRAYGTTFPTVCPARPGKNMGWTDWTHDPASRGKG